MNEATDNAAKAVGRTERVPTWADRAQFAGVASAGAGACHLTAAGIHAESPALARIFLIIGATQLIAGLVLALGSAAAIIAVFSYDSQDASVNNATGALPFNLLGPLGATAADILLQAFGLAAVAALAPPACWGIAALLGKHLRHAIWRAAAWPRSASRS